MRWARRLAGGRSRSGGPNSTAALCVLAGRNSKRRTSGALGQQRVVALGPAQGHGGVKGVRRR